MTKSKLTNVTILSPNHSGRRRLPVRKITIHHMAGNLTVEGCGNVFLNQYRQASSNYGIGTDGRIACYVEEENRAWTSSSDWNDQQAITIEVANNTLAPDWTISDKAYKSLIKLCADICERYNILPYYDSTIYGTLTEHRMYWATACPGPYIHNLLATGKIAKDINDALKPDVNKVTKFVKLLYNNVLGRNADASGLNHWVTMIVNKKGTPADVVKRFFNSKEYTSRGTSNDKFIEDCYRAYFNRKSDRNGFVYWKRRLNDKTPRNVILDDFGKSLEFRKLCIDMGVE